MPFPQSRDVVSGFHKRILLFIPRGVKRGLYNGRRKRGPPYVVMHSAQILEFRHTTRGSSAGLVRRFY